MEEFDADKFTRMASAHAERQQARIDQVLAMTDAEVDAINKRTEGEEVEKNQIFTKMSERPEVFFTLTGYHLEEFEELHKIVEKSLITTGRGRRTPLSTRDILFLLLYYLRRYPRFEEAAAMLSMRVSTLQTIIGTNIPKVSAVLKKKMIDELPDEYIQLSQDFPECSYVVDATVQETNRPALSFDDAKVYFSGKHYKYCLKSQVITTLGGIAVHVVAGIAGSVHDKSLFDQNYASFSNEVIAHHPDKPRKILADKGYQEKDSDKLVTPFKGNPLLLTASQNTFNEKLGCERIIIENYFGRLKLRFQIMYEKYRGDKTEYADVFVLCCALLNFEIIHCGHALRESDKKFYERFKALMGFDKEKIEKERKKKRKQQAEERQKKFLTSNGHSSDSDEE